MKLHNAVNAIAIAAVLRISTAQKPSACVEGGFSIEFDGECSTLNFLESYRNLYEDSCDHSVEEDFRLQLNLEMSASDDEVNSAVKMICKKAWENSEKIPYEYTHMKKDDQFEQIYYNGGTDWNEEVETLLETGERTNNLKEDSAAVKRFRDNLGRTAALEWPGNLANFDLETCKINTAMCCWPQDRQANDGNGNCNNPYDEQCYDKDPADNTDLCFVDLSRSLEGNRLNGTGIVNFPHDNSYGEGAIHCHGFAWANDDGDFTSRYKANNLFYVSMFDHMRNRGYVRNIPGAPMCACVEQMPTVSRSDCTQIDVLEEKYKIVHHPGTNDFTAELTKSEIAFNSCRGRYNRNNDLHAYVAKLVEQGKLSNDQRASLDKYIVGNGRCDQATKYEMGKKGLVTGFNHDESTWFKVAGSDNLYIDDIGREGFREMFSNSPEKIVWRVCASCVPSHQSIYYKRYTDVPEDFNLHEALLHWWSENDSNVANRDFKIFSTYEDAINDANPWTFYSFANERGFPFESGPTNRVRDQWRTFFRNWGRSDVAFYIMKPSTGGLNRVSSTGSLTGVNIGNPYRLGGTLEKTGTYYITGGGNDIWNYQDQFYFLQEESTGDMVIKVYLSSLHVRDTYTKAGLMIRDSLDDNSAHFSCLQMGNKGIVSHWRDRAGRWTSGSHSYDAVFKPTWLMATKIGNSFTCSRSDDGLYWISVGAPQAITMGESVHVGMAVTSHRWDRVAEAVFENYNNLPNTIQDGNGALLDTWYNVGGNSIASFANELSNPKYPDCPDERVTLPNLDVPEQRGDQLGSRLRTYIIPPYTGVYTFWIACDDVGELLLSDNEDPMKAEVIARVPGHTGRYQWNRYDAQESADITLEEGKLYYLEALYKEGGGGDHLAIAWKPHAHGDMSVISGLNTRAYDPPQSNCDDLERVVENAILETWYGIGGDAVADLINNAKYLAPPDATMKLSNLEAPSNRADNFGARLRTIIVPPKSGNYKFFIASDDNGELYLSSSDDPANKVLIANVPGYTDPQQWNRFVNEQQSDSIALEEGKSYYLEAIYKDGGGGDNLAIAWEFDGYGGPALIQSRYTLPISE